MIIKKRFIKTILFTLFFTTGYSLYPQKSDVLMINSHTIDEDRYDDIKGTPYLFKGWKYAEIVDLKNDTIRNILLNFNGKSGFFEIKKRDRFIELDPSSYTKIIVSEQPDINNDIIFEKASLPPLMNKFVRVVYQGKKSKVIQSFETKIETKIVNNVGKKEEFKRFYNREKYFFVKDNEIDFFKLKKKSLLPLLSNKESIEKFLKKEKMKLSNENQLVKLLEFNEKL